MAEYFTLLASSALSDFRLQALARELKAERVFARHVHYVAFFGGSRERFRDKDRQILDQLLDYGEPFQENLEDGDSERITTFFVSPRVGTISPWVRYPPFPPFVCS